MGALIGIISSFLTSTRIPGTSQNVGEAITSKTNISAALITGFTINYLTDHPESSGAWCMLGACLLAVTVRDTAANIIKMLKDIKPD